MHTIAVVNQKGGCGKTTTAINLAGVFASRGFRTLLVDLDPQAHCAAGLAIPEQRIDKHIGDAMLASENAPIDADRLLWRVSRNLDLAPSTVRLAALEAARGEFVQKADAESRLKRVLARFRGQYDICLIDCSPAIGMLTFNALVAADEILIPVETAFFSLHGAAKQVSTFKSVAKRLGVQPAYRLLPTMHDPNSVLARDLLEELRRRFPGRVAPVVIRLDSSLREAASFGQPVVEYSSESPGALDYGELASFLLEHSIGRGRGSVGSVEVLAAQPAVEHRGAEELRPAAAPPPTSPMPEVHIVPGIADRAVSRAAKQSLVTPVVAAAVKTAPVSTGVVRVEPAAVVDPPRVLMPTRAADLVARAKKLHGRGDNGGTHASGGSGGVGGGGAEEVASRDTGATAVAEPVSHAPTNDAPRPTTNEVWFGVRLTNRGVVFRQPLTLGRNVRIAGEFNNWSDVATPLRPHPTLGVLEGVARIAPGSFQYRLVVDTQWIADPYNPLVAPNPFGGANSIVFVPEQEVPSEPTGGQP